MTEPLTPEEEVAWMREIIRDPETRASMERLIYAYSVLETRAAMLLSLITLCLTITGFSGPSIAKSGMLSRVSICLGLTLVLLSAALLVAGPLQLRWATRRKEGSMDQSLAAMIRLRNKRTKIYHTAAFVLLAGLASYVLSVVTYMLHI